MKTKKTSARPEPTDDEVLAECKRLGIDPADNWTPRDLREFYGLSGAGWDLWRASGMGPALTVYNQRNKRCRAFEAVKYDLMRREVAA